MGLRKPSAWILMTSAFSFPLHSCGYKGSDKGSSRSDDSSFEEDSETGAGPCDPADADYDGFDSEVCGGTDCNDDDSMIYPGAFDQTDGVNSDCGEPDLISLDGSYIDRFDGPEWSDGMGTALFIGDYWGDGVSDFVINVTSADPYWWPGYVMFFDSASIDFASETTLDTSLATLFVGDEGSYGLAVWPLGDVDGDGLTDIILQNSPYETILFRGSHLASAEGLLSSANYDVTLTNGFPTGAASAFGDSGRLLGGDGTTRDVVLMAGSSLVVVEGATLYDGVREIDGEGEVVLFPDPAGPEVPPHEGEDGVAQIEHILLPGVVGDIDGDGLQELSYQFMVSDVSSSPFTLTLAMAIQMGGALDPAIPRWAGDMDVHLSSELSFREPYLSGISARDAGDIDGDGTSDVAFCDPLIDDAELRDAGRVWIWSGPRLAGSFGQDVSIADLTIEGHAERLGLGDDLKSLGDWDGDGRGDLLSGTTRPEGTSPSISGALASIYLGRDLGFGSIVDADDAAFTFFQDLPIDETGPDVSFDYGADMDGDGFGDFSFSDNRYPGEHGVPAGRAWLIPGSALSP